MINISKIEIIRATRIGQKAAPVESTWNVPDDIPLAKAVLLIKLGKAKDISDPEAKPESAEDLDEKAAKELKEAADAQDKAAKETKEAVEAAEKAAAAKKK